MGGERRTFNNKCFIEEVVFLPDHLVFYYSGMLPLPFAHFLLENSVQVQLALKCILKLKDFFWA